MYAYGSSPRRPSDAPNPSSRTRRGPRASPQVSLQVQGVTYQLMSQEDRDEAANVFQKDRERNKVRGELAKL